MIKKILLVLLCSLTLVSCGKKADPEFKEAKINIPEKLKIY